MKQIYKHFQKLDFISRNFSFEHNGSTIYKTYQGAFFSLVTFLSAFIIAFMFGREIYQRKLPNVNTSLETIEDSTLYLNRFPLIFALYNNQGNMIDDIFDYFDIQVDCIVYNESEGPFLTTNYSLILKNDDTRFLEFEDITEEYFNLNKNNSLYIFNFTEYDALRNIMGAQNSNSFRIQFKLCDLTDLKRNCKADIDFINSIPFVMVRHIDFNIDSLSYENPIKPYLKAIFYSVSKKAQKMIYYYFVNSYYESDNGWIFEDKATSHFYTKTDSDYDLNNNESNSNVRNFLTIIFSGDKLQNRVIRNYLKVQELFAKVGGIANAVFIIVKILTFHYLRFTYLSFIRRNSFVDKADEDKISLSQNKILNNYKCQDRNINQVSYENCENKHLDSQNNDVYINNKSNSYIDIPENINNNNINNNNSYAISNLVEYANKEFNRRNLFNDRVNQRNLNSKILTFSENTNNPIEKTINNTRILNNIANTSNISFIQKSNLKKFVLNSIDNNSNHIKKEKHLINNNILPKTSQNKDIQSNSQINNEDIVYKNISSKHRIHCLIKSKLVIETEEKELSYFKYILSYICFCCYDKGLKKIYNNEFQRVKDLLDIRLFKQFLIKSYYEKFKFKY